jgi:S-adenosylmethionine:tRNA ribosyltransferase-isomerase
VLHVGAGTFKPVDVEDPDEHVMHEEHYTLPAETAAAWRATRAAGHRVWAVGTTTVRTLESAYQDGTMTAGDADTRIFLRPPRRIHSVDALITNFHLPRSTLIMLVATFAGYDLTMRAYREAIAAQYRFYSYGDAMAFL